MEWIGVGLVRVVDFLGLFFWAVSGAVLFIGALVIPFFFSFSFYVIGGSRVLSHGPVFGSSSFISSPWTLGHF